jgi:Fe-S-cluster containining protein
MASEKPRSVALALSAVQPVIDENVWYAPGLRFACTQCGNCCSGGPGYVWLTEGDMERIADYLHISFDEFTRTYVRRIGNRYSLTEKYNYDCTFLTRDGQGKTGCMIYPVRPMQCKTWPFWEDNLKSPRAWKNASERGAGCPGMCDAAAPLYPLDHIERCRQHPESPR